jgi:nitrite reductase (NO-forming)
VPEKLIEVDDEGTTIWAFTYDGFVPGTMIFCHKGNYVELILKSDAPNVLEHNIDFRAATGAMGGGELTKILPGEQVVLRWRALMARVFVYHCAAGGEMTPYHVTHGMNGAVMACPRRPERRQWRARTL